MKATQFRCLACGMKGDMRAVRVNAWGDALCPRCGSLRVERIPARLELLKNFLIEYNRY